jgi:predicted nucleotidyltransferase
MERKTTKRAVTNKPLPGRAVRSGDGRKQASVSRAPSKRAPFKLVTRRQIRAVVERIVEAVHPEKIILFGSYAYGHPTTDSDVDLLVVMESDERPAKRAIRIARHLLDVPFPMDILVRTPAEIGNWLRLEDCFMREVVRQGQVLYER